MHDIEFKAVPVTGNRLTINSEGTIFNDGSVVSGDPNFEWFDGVRTYERELVLALTVAKTNLPFSLWGLLKVDYLDGNSSNKTLSNLGITHKLPIACNRNYDFFIIPGCSTYATNRDGVVINRRNGRKLTPTFKRGYASIELVSDGGGRKTFYRHRLVLLSCANIPTNYRVLYVNHINGIPGDDRIVNLEWVTPGENVRHALDHGLHTVKAKKVIVRDIFNGEQVVFNSIKEAARNFDKHYTEIVHFCRTNGSKVMLKRYQLKFEDDQRAFTDIKDPSEYVDKMLQQREVHVKTMGSDEVLSFKSQRDASIFLGISEATMTTWLSKPDKVRKLENKYIMVRIDNEFPEIKDYVKDFQENSLKKIVLVEFLDTGIIQEHESAKECANALNMLQTTLNWWLKDPRPRKGLLVRYKYLPLSTVR